MKFVVQFKRGTRGWFIALARTLSAQRQGYRKLRVNAPRMQRKHRLHLGGDIFKLVRRCICYQRLDGSATRGLPCGAGPSSPGVQLQYAHWPIDGTQVMSDRQYPRQNSAHAARLITGSDVVTRHVSWGCRWEKFLTSVCFLPTLNLVIGSSGPAVSDLEEVERLTVGRDVAHLLKATPPEPPQPLHILKCLPSQTMAGWRVGGDAALTNHGAILLVRLRRYTTRNHATVRFAVLLRRRTTASWEYAVWGGHTSRGQCTEFWLLTGDVIFITSARAAFRQPQRALPDTTNPKLRGYLPFHGRSPLLG